MAGGVLLDLHRIGPQEVRALGLLDDSKRLSEETRQELLPVVMRIAVRSVAIVRSPRSIDKDGLHVSNLAALREALEAVAVPGAICLSDGFSVGSVDGCETRAIVKGDATSAAIAAASIVAKVTRDRAMRRAAEVHPHWGFEEHVGYSTPAHRDAIAVHGVSPIHRMSFASTAYTQLTL